MLRVSFRVQQSLSHIAVQKIKKLMDYSGIMLVHTHPHEQALDLICNMWLSRLAIAVLCSLS
jgi:hypothetical protein